MKFTSKHILLASLFGIFANQLVFAQDGTFADINYIRKSNPVIGQSNASSLIHYNSPNITDASIYFTKEDGGFRNYFKADNAQTYGLQAQSYTRLSKKVVLQGGFEYQNFEGKNMGGSAFINPYNSPFDIVEMNVANSGTKQLELYKLNGAIGSQLTNKLSIGGKLNYEAANYAKRKDLRHINKQLDMDLSVGAMYKIATGVAFGANYNYGRRVESISFKTFGAGGTADTSLISFGSFYGKKELFTQTGYGYTASQSTNPLKDITNGFAVQLNVDVTPKTKLYNEFAYDFRAGFFGEDGTASVMLTKHNGHSFKYNGKLIVAAKSAIHAIGLQGSYDYLNNNENIFRRGTTDGGVTIINYYGSNTVFSGETININLNYDLFLGVKNNSPNWELNLQTSYWKRDQSTHFYPYFRDQTLSCYQFSADLYKNIKLNKGVFKVGGGLALGTGSGDLTNDGTIVAPAGGATPPSTSIQYLNEEYEYLTAARYSANINLKYTKALQNNISGYLKLNLAHIFAPDVNYLKSHYNLASLALGCNF